MNLAFFRVTDARARALSRYSFVKYFCSTERDVSVNPRSLVNRFVSNVAKWVSAILPIPLKVPRARVTSAIGKIEEKLWNASAGVFLKNGSKLRRLLLLDKTECTRTVERKQIRVHRSDEGFLITIM